MLESIEFKGGAYPGSTSDADVSRGTEPYGPVLTSPNWREETDKVLALTEISKQTKVRVLALTFILLNLADILLMLSAVHSGALDLNPFIQALFGPGLAGTVLFKIGGSAFFAWVMCLKRQERVLRIAVIAMIAVCLMNLTALSSTAFV